MGRLERGDRGRRGGKRGERLGRREGSCDSKLYFITSFLKSFSTTVQFVL